MTLAFVNHWIVVLVAAVSCVTPAAYSDTGTGASITDYGARGNGSDDRAAIQRALDANAGGAVRVPPGRWFVGRAGSAYFGLTVPAGTTLACDAGAVLVQLAGAAPSVRLIEVDAPGATIVGCELDGQRAVQSPDSQRHGVFVRGTGVVLRGVRVHDFTGDGVYLYPGADGATLDGITAEGNGRNGVTDNASGATITGSTFRGNAAQQFDSEPGTHVDNVRIAGSTFDALGASNDYVLTICGSATAQSTGWTVEGNAINGGAYVVWASDIVLRGNTGLNATSKPSVTVYRKTERIAIEGNAFTSLAASGIVVTGTGTGQAPSDVAIRGNTLTVGGPHGIALSGAASATLEGNVITHPVGEGASAIAARATNPAVSFAAVTLRRNVATGFGRGLSVAGMVGVVPQPQVSMLVAANNSLGGWWYLDEGSGALQAATLTDNADEIETYPSGYVLSTTTTMTRRP